MGKGQQECVGQEEDKASKTVWDVRICQLSGRTHFYTEPVLFEGSVIPYQWKAIFFFLEEMAGP